MKKNGIKLTEKEEENLLLLKTMFKKRKKETSDNLVIYEDTKAIEILKSIKEDVINFFKAIWQWFNSWGLEAILAFLMLFTIVNATVHITGAKIFKDYDDYTEYMIPQNYAFEFKDSYYIYIYSNNCSACASIKRNIFQYLESPKNDTENGIRMYLMCADDFNNSGAGDTLIGVDNADNIKVKSVPYLIFVDGKNNRVMNEWNTTGLILDQLKMT